jgi:hypothetical protein
MNYYITYAIYDKEPIPCEGDDPITESLSIMVFDVVDIREYATLLGIELSNYTDKYYSIWDLQET